MKYGYELLKGEPYLIELRRRSFSGILPEVSLDHREMER